MHKTVAVTDLAAIERNAARIRGLVGNRQLYAVVKADAYGHGAERVSLALQPHIDGFCVAISEEGAALRNAGITKPVLVLTPLTAADDAEVARFYGLTVTVNGVHSARLACGLACHIKVNTGMNRYGCTVEELPAVLSAAQNVQGIYSHLYCPEDIPRSAAQLRLFNIAERMAKAQNPRIVAHLSASGGLHLGQKYYKDGVRVGISLYGYMPRGCNAEGLALERALKVYARRVQTLHSVGGGIGYAPAQREYKTLSVYRLGYGDGFFRGVPLGEGNLCMDAFISSEDGEELKAVFSDADEYAARAGTISYEALCSVAKRSHKIYLN